MSEQQQEQDFRFSSELSYMGMLDDFAKNNVEQNSRVENFGSNIWFPDITGSFPNFGNSVFSRAAAKDEALYVNEESPEVQLFNRDGVTDIRVNIDEGNIITDLPFIICKYTLAFENICTRQSTKPGVIQFNLGVLWATEEQVEEIADMLGKQINFPIHP